MISLTLILSLLNLLIFLIILIQLPFRKSVSYSIMNGTICYRCKDDIPLLNPDNWMISGNGERKLCKACERDVKLSSVTGIRKIYFTSNSKFSTKVQIALGLLGILFTILGIIYKPLGVVGSGFVFSSTLCFLINHLSTTKAKKINFRFRKK